MALDRSEAVIVCGGLGPTHDDLTRDAIAAVMGVELVRDPAVAERIRSLFGSRGRHMPENNLRQADVPEGASVIPQMPGTAPGLICPVGEKVVYAVPGVPFEMQQMVAETALPDLRRRMGRTAAIRSRVLRTWGQSESGSRRAARRPHQRARRDGEPHAGVPGERHRGTQGPGDGGWPDTEAEADALVAAEVDALGPILGDLVFSHDDRSMEEELLDVLRRQGRTLATAESFTGGLIGSRATSVPGASDAYVGGVVADDARAKHEVLGVPEGPVVTEDAARAMAEGVRKRLSADAAVATTGVAGPDEQEGETAGPRPPACGRWTVRPTRSRSASPGTASACGSSPRSRCSTRCAGPWSSASSGPATGGAPASGRDPRRELTVSRLFVAAFPPEEVLDVLAGLPRPDEAGVRYTHRDQWHVTLRFLGQADEQEAATALGRLDAAPAEVTLGPQVSRLGRNVAVVPASGLDEVAAAVAEVTAEIGEPSDP
ncbi:MAG: nicotinamide-nucleotide amidohydrolase family protein [Acidimicrobiia bacterium]|nr:nicotinamide-nucleotide amidohydrolase family protein [Acidimicrobiia bacterium]